MRKYTKRKGKYFVNKPSLVFKRQYLKVIDADSTRVLCLYNDVEGAHRICVTYTGQPVQCRWGKRCKRNNRMQCVMISSFDDLYEEVPALKGKLKIGE